MIMSAPGRILIVDDERDICANMKDILEDMDYAVDIATSASEALKLAEDHSYLLALVDFRMPESDGIELFCALRERAPNLIGILVTAYSRDAMPRAVECGFEEVMSKPVDIQTLLPMIGRMMAN